MTGNHPDHFPSAIPTSPLFKLPTEIHNQILARLPWPSLAALRLTHPYFTHTLLPPSALPSLHTHHRHLTHSTELYHLRTTLGYTNPNYTGFTQGWCLSPLISLSPTLPCYHCLDWLASADTELRTSAFSRGMATGKRDLGQEKATGRLCVACGLRCGFYARGNRVRHQAVCYGCGALGERIREKDGLVETSAKGEETQTGGLLKGSGLRWRYFCRRCIGEGDGGTAPGTRVEFEHWRRWRRYESGMQSGKRNRDEKGKRLREERGVQGRDVGGEGSSGGSRSVWVPKHECPVLKEKRMCQCWKAEESGLPEWAVSIQRSQWAW